MNIDNQLIYSLLGNYKKYYLYLFYFKKGKVVYKIWFVYYIIR